MVYLDNAATSFPKAPGVAAAMAEYVEKVGATINRSSYAAAQEAGLVTLTLRERLCRAGNSRRAGAGRRKCRERRRGGLRSSGYAIRQGVRAGKRKESRNRKRRFGSSRI